MPVRGAVVRSMVSRAGVGYANLADVGLYSANRPPSVGQELAGYEAERVQSPNHLALLGDACTDGPPRLDRPAR